MARIAEESARNPIFQTHPSEVEGRSLYLINGGAWNREDLKGLFEQVLPQRHDIRAFEFTHTFSALGKRTFIIDARELDDLDSTPSAFWSRWKITAAGLLQQVRDVLESAR